LRDQSQNIPSKSQYILQKRKWDIRKEKGDRKMAIRTIRIMGDACLKKQCKPIQEITPKIKELIDDMFETMYAARGVGLAAPQVGILKRLVVIDVMDDNPLTLINPEIIYQDGEQTDDEGCLSVPGKCAAVTRPMYVECKAYDENMEEFVVEASGLLARAICHELDHLDGILYPEKALEPLHDVEEE
jgi:peptide deformylase